MTDESKPIEECAKDYSADIVVRGYESHVEMAPDVDSPIVLRFTDKTGREFKLIVLPPTEYEEVVEYYEQDESDDPDYDYVSSDDY